ncbi:unnamed protein product [Meganyctiphanes norvegica]|uniref:Uncharacterized protein n=1 Tax=Meganyctiphanes norvegica TaxID=48144 RepID=A0AAV2QAI5_MEGNR
MNVMDSESNFTESSSKKLVCSETVGINLKETSVISINPKHSKTNENESIKDNKRTVSIKKGKSTSSKPEKFSLEPMPDYNIETDQSHVTKDEVSTFSASTAEDKQNVACKATYSLDLYRTTSKSSNDTENEPSMITDKQNVAFKAKDSLDYYRNKASNVKKKEFQSSFQVKGKLDIVKTNAQPVKSILKSKIDLSKEPESLESLIDRRIKVEIVEQKPKTFTNDSDNTNESVVFIKQLQLPPKNEIDMNPRVSTPICKEEKLDFVDPELSAIISEEEIAPEVDESVLILNTNSSEVPKDTESLTAYKKAPLKDSIIPNDSNNSIHLNISLDSNIKAQAKDESHNEAMILETDLDQCLDNKKDTSIYSPQDKMETLSVSEGNFLTLSEASRSPTITELSATPNLDDIGVKDKGLVDIFSKKGDITHISESDNVRKDYESEATTKTFSDSIQLSEDLHASKKIKISMNKKSENIMEKPPTATVKPLNSESSTSSKLDNEASRTDKRKLLPESMENREKRTRINAPNLKDGSRQFSNYRRGGSNSATYSGQGSRFRPNYDSNHYPRSGVPPAAYQQPYHQPWHPRTTDNYRPRMHNQHPYNWNYQW